MSSLSVAASLKEPAIRWEMFERRPGRSWPRQFIGSFGRVSGGTACRGQFPRIHYASKVANETGSGRLLHALRVTDSSGEQGDYEPWSSPVFVESERGYEYACIQGCLGVYVNTMLILSDKPWAPRGSQSAYYSRHFGMDTMALRKPTAGVCVLSVEHAVIFPETSATYSTSFSF